MTSLKRISDGFFATLKYLSQTRLASRESSLTAMDSTFQEVVLFLEKLDANETGEAGAKAHFLLIFYSSSKF